MKTVLILLFSVTLQTFQCQDINKYFEKINKNTVEFNSVAAEIAWKSTVNPGNPNLQVKSANYQRRRINWEQSTCDKLVTLNNGHLLNNTQRRQTYLLCRGPKFTFQEAREMSLLYEKLQSAYSDAEICLPTRKLIKITDFEELEYAILEYISKIQDILKEESDESILLAAKKAVNSSPKNGNVICLNGDGDMQKIIKFSKNEKVLRFIWLVWREKVGPPMRENYRRLAIIENQAAIRNGYPDIGASWRDELEINNLRLLCRQLYDDIRPLYSLLHGVTRFYLRRRYGDVVPEHGPIPAHLLGDLWAQNWEPLSNMIVPQTIDVDKSIKQLNWTVHHMVKRAEDFYRSLSLPAMTDKFWQESVFSGESHENIRCHGTAADMFKHGDFRLLYCSEKTAEDLYVMHHEMGHIQYYMAYEHQPGIFRQANTAFHETIGDTIMLGVMTPQHLYRLGLINDSILYTNNALDYDDNTFDFNFETNNNLDSTQAKIGSKYLGLNYHDATNIHNEENEDVSKTSEGPGEPSVNVSPDEILMLKQALNKLPQIPFSLLIDEFRWKYFEGKLSGSINKEFWDMALELQGIEPPGERGEEYFDVGAKFHVPDNTPYIRYFLSSFLQHQLFESMCKAAVFGRRNVRQDLPYTITMNRCDIYGSKSAGKLLKDFMSRGNSQPWREILQATTGSNEISATALKRYYRPVLKLLTRFVRAYRIPIGW